MEKEDYITFPVAFLKLKKVCCGIYSHSCYASQQIWRCAVSKLRIFQLLLAGLSILGWLMAVWAMILFHYARPDTELNHYFTKGVGIRLFWDPVLTLRLEQVIWIVCGISLVSLMFNIYIAHHSRMGYWFNIPLLLLSSLTAGLYISFFI